MAIRTIPSPTKNLESWNQMIHWGWYDSTEDVFVVSNQRNLWAIDPSSGKTECILERKESERITPEGVGLFDSCSVSHTTLKAFIDEGIRGFKFLKLHEYGLEEEEEGNVLMYLSHSLTWGLNGRIAVRHRLDSENTLSFKDRTVCHGREIKRFSEHTHVHYSHPSELAFFTGNNKGEVYWHRFDETGFKKSVKVHDSRRTISDLAISESGDDLLIAAQGSLAWLQQEGPSYKKVSEIQCSPRQVILSRAGTVIVNQGSNGMSVFRMDGQLIEESSQQIGHSNHMIIPNKDEEMFLSLPQGKGENLAIINQKEESRTRRWWQRLMPRHT